MARARGVRRLLVSPVLMLAASAAAPAAAAATTTTTTTTATKAITKAATKDRPRLVTIPSPSSPLVAVRVFFQVGSADDPPGKEGLAALTAEMIGKGGTRSRSYADVLDALYPLAAQIKVVGDRESVVFEGMVHRDNLVAFSELVAEQVTAPRFAEDDFARNRQNAMDAITKTLRGNDDEELGKQSLAAALYAGHPYGHPPAGTVAGLGAITLDDVRAFYARHYARDRLTVGVAGGYPDGFGDTFAARFAGLPARGAPLPKLPRATPGKRIEVLLVEKSARAAAVSLGYPIAITRSHPDFYPLTVARSYLGEHRTFNGLLMNKLRGERGLNYGDYAYVESFIQDGWSTFPHPNIPRRQQHFEIWLRPVPTQNALFALRGAVHYTRRLIKEGIPQEGFEATRRFLAGYADLWTQDLSRRLGYAIDAAIYGKDLVGELKVRLAKMKKADVDRVIRKYLQMNAFTVAIVAEDAAKLGDALVEGKPTPITYDTQGTPPATLEEDKLIEQEPLALTRDQVRVVPAEQMFERDGRPVAASPPPAPGAGAPASPPKPPASR
jgi:zinc protease